MTTIATCGHEIDGIGDLSFWKDETRECQPCYSYGVLCPECIKQYREWEILLDTEKAADEWLSLEAKIT